MIVRAKSLKTGEVMEFEITADIPAQRRLVPEELRFIYPKRPGKPNSLATIKRWIKDGLIKAHHIGKQTFINPNELPDVIAGATRTLQT